MELVKKLYPEYKALHLQVAFHVDADSLQGLLYTGKEMEG